jgi:glycosyltransferase involved in cell wall biosynthesis
LFVLCGTGDIESVYRSEAVGIPNVIMPGWIDGCQIRMILELAAIAIGPLPDRPDFRSTINNKFVEYLSGSLPVLVSPADCYAARLVIDRDCGRGFDLDRPGSLAALLRDALADEGLLSRWAANAKSLFDEKFRADYVLPRWVSYLHGMAASTSPKQ